MDESLFLYGSCVLDGTVLERHSLKICGSGDVVFNVCVECFTTLQRNRLPRLSLANFLYRGKLPDEFRDLTWVEEMVCAKYWNSAHVTHLYGSSDPSQPKLFHGNTCAHKMNVLSTATVFPCTTSDVNDMLTVVFIGSRKFDVDCLHVMFRVQKSKIWRLLIWLTTHNRLYTDIRLDPSIMNSYPEDDVDKSA